MASNSTLESIQDRLSRAGVFGVGFWRMSRSSPGERVLQAEGMAAARVYFLSLSCWIMLPRALSTKLCPWQMLSPHLLNLQEKLYSQEKRNRKQCGWLPPRDGKDWNHLTPQIESRWRAAAEAREVRQPKQSWLKKKKLGWSLGLQLSWEGRQFMAKGSRLTVNKNTVTLEFPMDRR